MAIYGVIVAIILQTKIDYTDKLPNGMWPMPAATAGYAILGAGLTTGFSNLACGYNFCCQLICASTCHHTAYARHICLINLKIPHTLCTCKLSLYPPLCKFEFFELLYRQHGWDSNMILLLCAKVRSPLTMIDKLQALRRHCGEQRCSLRCSELYSIRKDPCSRDFWYALKSCPWSMCMEASSSYKQSFHGCRPANDLPVSLQREEWTFLTNKFCAGSALGLFGVIIGKYLAGSCIFSAMWQAV